MSNKKPENMSDEEKAKAAEEAKIAEEKAKAAEKEKAKAETGSIPLKPVELTIKREHFEAPHFIELRRGGTDKVIEVRTQDSRHTETIGAKSVEQMFSENGASVPNTGETYLMTFSPHDGAIITIARDEKADEATSEEGK
jgi:hypothetical protein